MSIRHPRRYRDAGFTLIEMLVVVLIIGVVMSFVSLSLNPTGPADQLDTEAKRLDALTCAAADDAILYGREIGLDITRDGYRFLRLGDDGWKPINVPDSPLRARKLSEGVVIALIEQDDDTPRLASGGDDEDAIRPEALFLSSGETVPFVLELSANGVDHLYHLSGEAGGTLTLDRLEVDR
ncbi:type II secretion system minor pseudopilin GspH [Salinisphaera aquimarina]|uniref:Type II secretion system protein H n=1 Tax=Salinisphaera aquimarina TaxID=2094031 RepID=A0ABV7ERV9_9GAMM